MQKRIRLLGLAMIVLLGAVLVQAANVQFWRAHSLATNPNNPRVFEAKLTKARGEILAADGSILAQSLPTPKGVYKYQRSYPQGALMGQITGFDSPIYGTWGIESYYNSQLLSHAQPARSLSQLLSPTTSTDSVTLTIVPELQKLAASQLAGRDGAIVALDPRTGAVEAMYSNPNYDPNPLAAPNTAVERQAWAAYQVKNANGFAPLVAMAYQRTFPPGSTFKVVTATAAYDLRPDLVSKSYPQESSITIPNTPLPLQNFGAGTCGGTLVQMLPPSCDTGFAQMGLDLGAQNLYQTAVGFGWDSRPPLDLPGVAISNFPTPAQLKDNVPFLAYGAIGQGDVAATALQNALDAAAIANNGQLMAPDLLSSIRDSQGNLIQQYKPKLWKTTTSPETAQSISQLMQQVVTEGTAYGIFDPADKVAAKTGTAQTSATNINEKTDDWMIAFAPADHPVIAIAVLLPFQALSGTGAAVAGPVMNCMIQGALAHAAHQPVTNTSTTCSSH
jgi:peptidoglycan glycosyltransferase